jgi:beta-glucosidase
MSYSTFEFSNLKVERQKIAPGESLPVSVDVRNTGGRVADEVAQLYIHQRYGTSARPVRELKGFQRVTLKPGETRTIRFTLTAAELTYWTSAKRAWVQDETTYDVYVGNSSQAALTTTFEVGKQ